MRWKLMTILKLLLFSAGGTRIEDINRAFNLNLRNAVSAISYSNYVMNNSLKRYECFVNPLFSQLKHRQTYSPPIPSAAFNSSDGSHFGSKTTFTFTAENLSWSLSPFSISSTMSGP